MSRFNTGNPLGSGDPRDLDDNAKNMDLAVNSDELRWSDRFGRDRKSFEGMEREFDSDQASREARFNDFIVSSGYQFLDDYGPGIEITEYNQLVRDEDGEFWRLSGQVELPYTTTGAGIPEDDALVPAGDAVLRQDLADPDKGAAMVAYVGPGGEAYSLADLADPDKGAAMVARGVVAVDSIADLLALPGSARREDLRYLVKGYHSGSNLGGGAFAYLPSSEATPNGVTVFSDGEDSPGRFVRLPAAYLDAHCAGGDSYTGDPFEALQLLLDILVPHGTVSTSGWSGEKTFDSLININKPCTLVGSWDVQFKLADQSSVFHGTAHRNRANLINVNSSDVTVCGMHIDSNKLGNFVTFGEVNYFFNEMDPPVPGADDSIFRYLGCISMVGPYANVEVFDNRLINCSVHAVLINGGIPAEGGGIPDRAQPNLYARNIRVHHNTISGGCRSGIAFTSGVIDSGIYGNVAIDWCWSAFRVYLQTSNCYISGNLATADLNADPTTFENSTTNYPPVYFCGPRVGHSVRAPGTCFNTRVEHNVVRFTGVSVDRPVNGIRVESGVRNCKIAHNRIHVLVEATYSTDYPSLLASTGAINTQSCWGIDIVDNHIESPDYAPICAFELSGGVPRDVAVRVRRNRIVFSGPQSQVLTGGGVRVQRSSIALPSEAAVIIERNELVGMRRTPIYVDVPNFSGELMVIGNTLDGSMEDTTINTLILLRGPMKMRVVGNAFRVDSSVRGKAGVNLISPEIIKPFVADNEFDVPDTDTFLPVRMNDPADGVDLNNVAY